LTADDEVLAAVFAARVKLAKETEAEALDAARQEWCLARNWVKSNSKKEGSFLYCCDYFDLEPDAVRKAVETRVG
jgi:hypothetical protein